MTLRVSVPMLLRNGAKKKNISQKELGQQTHIGRGTISNYLTDDYPIPIDEMVNIAKAINDDETVFNLVFELLGTLPMFNGSKIKNSADAYANFMEDEEQEERTYLQINHIKSKLSSQYLSDSEKHDVRCWSLELLDEILMELGVLMRAAEASDTSVRNLIHERMPIYIEKHYMKGADEYAGSRSRSY